MEFDWLDFETGPGSWGGDVPAGWGGDVFAGGTPNFDESAAWKTFTGWGTPNAGDPWNSPMPADTPGWEAFTGWGDPTGPGSSGESGGGFWGTLGGLASGAGGLAKTLFGGGGGGAGGGAGIGGPLLSALGSLGGGAIGSNAANEAARLQAAALNRGIDLQTAQWLQQQQNLAPYLQAGQQGLSTLQGLAGREQPALPGATGTRNAADYPMASAQPGWTPQNYQGPQNVNAQDYRYTPQASPWAWDYAYHGPDAVQAGNFQWQPGQGPQAADYRYTPGQTPDAANYRYTPGAVPTLSGQELLANDPGVAFRMAEGRKALEASAAAKGGLLSGPTLAALQRQGQELSSQEYGQAWNRAAQQAQMREQWGQQATAQNFGQAMSAAQLREQLQQVATQQGWSQAQTEAVFREQMAQQASQQGFSQALSAQGQQWQQGMAGQEFDWRRVNQESQTADERARAASQLGFGQAMQGQQAAYGQGLQSQQWQQQQAQQYESELYNRMMGQNTLRYGRDVAQNQTDYDRQQALYRQQLGQHLLPWEQASTLAGLGQKATGTYGEQSAYNSRGMSDLLAQLGTAQGQGAAGSGLMWNRALTGAANQVPSLLAGLNA